LVAVASWYRFTGRVAGIDCARHATTEEFSADSGCPLGTRRALVGPGGNGPQCPGASTRSPCADASAAIVAAAFCAWGGWVLERACMIDGDGSDAESGEDQEASEAA